MASTSAIINGKEIGALLQGLISFQDLHYLWPQLLVRCGSRRVSVITIDGFLKRLSEDLAGHATIMSESDGRFCLAASERVRKRRLEIAHGIWETHCEELENEEGTNDDIAGLRTKNPGAWLRQRHYLRRIRAVHIRNTAYTGDSDQCQGLCGAPRIWCRRNCQ